MLIQFNYFIKPVPKGVVGGVDCTYPKCRNKGNWNINNGSAIYCDKHLLQMMKDKEASYLIVNKSLQSLLKEEVKK